MSYITLSDALEHFLKYRDLDKRFVNSIRLVDRKLLAKIIDNCVEKGYVVEDSDKYKLISLLDFIIVLEEFGIDTTHLSNYITWQEFEDYIARKFIENGFEVYTNIEHRHVTAFQIDVVAVDISRSIALFIECKHWRRGSMGIAMLKQIVDDHVKRIEKYLKSCEYIVADIPILRRVQNILPIIVTLRTTQTRVVDSVPIVSIRYLQDFITNLSIYIHELNLKLHRNRCYSKASA